MKHSGLVVVGALALVAMTGPGVADPAPPLACSVVDPRVTCVMTGLDDPRGLAFGPGGALFVAEAGRGGAPCPPTGTGALTCYGLTGAVSRLWHGRQDRVVSGLPSLSFPQGANARGPHDIVMRFGEGHQESVLGGKGAHVTIGLEADPATRAALNRPDLGKLVHIPARALLAPSTDLCDHDCWRPIVDIAAYEIGGGPDSGVPESDPYGLLVERRGHGRDDDQAEDDERGRGRHDDGDDDDGEEGERAGDVVVDASGNSLLRVDADGEISLLAVFPSRSTVPPRPVPAGVTLTDSVPTSVAVGPDGAYYVGELTGIPFTGPKRDRSNIYRVEAGQDPYHPTVFLDGQVTGFNAIIDIAFKGRDLYILQHWTTSTTAIPRDGKLIRVACGGRPFVCDGVPTTVLGGLDGPTSIAVGPDGALYVTNHGASPAFAGGVYTPMGEVLRIDDGDGCDHHGGEGGDDDHHGDDGHHGDAAR